MSPLKAAFEHFTGVWDVEKTLAVHHDRRGFAEQRLNPALDAAARDSRPLRVQGGRLPALQAQRQPVQTPTLTLTQCQMTQVLGS